MNRLTATGVALASATGALGTVATVGASPAGACTTYDNVAFNTPIPATGCVTHSSADLQLANPNISCTTHWYDRSDSNLGPWFAHTSQELICEGSAGVSWNTLTFDDMWKRPRATDAGTVDATV